MPSRKVTMRASMANQTSHFGIMGGLAKGRTSGASGNRATNKLVIPRGAAKGLAYMQLHGILSRNPQTGGVGKVVKSKPCNCNGLGKTAVEGGGGGVGGGGGGVGEGLGGADWPEVNPKDVVGASSSASVGQGVYTIESVMGCAAPRFEFSLWHSYFSFGVVSQVQPSAVMNFLSISRAKLLPWSPPRAFTLGTPAIFQQTMVSDVASTGWGQMTGDNVNACIGDGDGDGCVLQASQPTDTAGTYTLKIYKFVNGQVSGKELYRYDSNEAVWSGLIVENSTKGLGTYVPLGASPPSGPLLGEITMGCGGCIEGYELFNDGKPGDVSYCKLGCPLGSVSVIAPTPFAFNGSSQVCQPCQAGTFAAEGDFICNSCPIGQVQADAGQATCNKCPIGQFQAARGQATCNNCPANQGQAGPSAASCSPCLAGQSSVLGGACSACLAGQSSVLGGACSACPAGTFSVAGGDCSTCPIGTYSDTSGTPNSCSDCSNGTTYTNTADGQVRYARTGATGCDRRWHWPEAACISTVGGRAEAAVGTETQGSFCCASGSDGFYQLSGTPDCSGIGTGGAKSNLCRLSGASSPFIGACDISGCNEMLGGPQAPFSNTAPT